MYDEQAVGRAIRELRDGLGMSQADLADALRDEGLPGFYPQTIVKLEQGRRSLKFVEAMAMANVMGIDPKDLLDWENNHLSDPHAMRLVRMLGHSAEKVWRSIAEYEARWNELNEYAANPDTDLSESVRVSVEAHLGTEPHATNVARLFKELVTPLKGWGTRARQQ